MIIKSQNHLKKSIIFIRKRLLIECSLQKSCKCACTIQIWKRLKLKIWHRKYHSAVEFLPSLYAQYLQYLFCEKGRSADFSLQAMIIPWFGDSRDLKSVNVHFQIHWETVSNPFQCLICYPFCFYTSSVEDTTLFET